MPPALHIYPPQPSRDMKPVPRSLQHQSPQRSNRSLNHRQSPPSPTPSHSFLRPPSHQIPTVTQPLHSPLRLPHPQTSTTQSQSSRRLLLLPPPQTPQKSVSSLPLTPTGSTDNLNQLAVAFKSTKSAGKRTSDAEDPFTSAGGRENLLLVSHKAQAEVRCSWLCCIAILTENRHPF